MSPLADEESVADTKSAPEGAMTSNSVQFVGVHGVLALIALQMKSHVAREFQQRVIAKGKAPPLVDTFEFVVVTTRSDWLQREFVGCLEDRVVGAYRRLA